MMNMTKFGWIVPFRSIRLLPGLIAEHDQILQSQRMSGIGIHYVHPQGMLSGGHLIFPKQIVAPASSADGQLGGFHFLSIDIKLGTENKISFIIPGLTLFWLRF